jgi:hypothetical protein
MRIHHGNPPETDKKMVKRSSSKISDFEKTSKASITGFHDGKGK